MQDNTEANELDNAKAEVAKALEASKVPISAGEGSQIHSSFKPQPNYIDQLAKKKQELESLELRLDEKKALLEQEATSLIMAGKSFAGQGEKPKTEKELKAEAIKKMLEGTNIDPFRGAGGSAL